MGSDRGSGGTTTAASTRRARRAPSPSASARGGRRGRSVGADLAVFVVRRLVAGAFLLAAVAAATFLLISLAPGDTADVLAGQSGADPAYLELLRRPFHLDRPLPEQVGSYLLAVGRGDLGYSAVQGEPVTAVVGGPPRA